MVGWWKVGPFFRQYVCKFVTRDANVCLGPRYLNFCWPPGEGINGVECVPDVLQILWVVFNKVLNSGLVVDTYEEVWGVLGDHPEPFCDRLIFGVEDFALFPEVKGGVRKR